MPDIAICKPLYRVLIGCTMLSAPIGPAGDVLYVPFYFSGGEVRIEESSIVIVGGGDFAAIHFDEKMAHQGRFVAQSELGPVLFFYHGTSEGADGTYDSLLDGRLPSALRSTFSVRCVSAIPPWRALNHLHLPATGLLDIADGTLRVTVWSVPR